MSITVLVISVTALVALLIGIKVIWFVRWLRKQEAAENHDKRSK